MQRKGEEAIVTDMQAVASQETNYEDQIAHMFLWR